MVIHKGYAKFNYSSVQITYPNSRETFSLMHSLFCPCLAEFDNDWVNVRYHAGCGAGLLNHRRTQPNQVRVVRVQRHLRFCHLQLHASRLRRDIDVVNCAVIFKQSVGARNRVGIGLSYRPARLHSLAKLHPWNRFLGSITV
jgi:hypothetical protein